MSERFGRASGQWFRVAAPIRATPTTGPSKVVGYTDACSMPVRPGVPVGWVGDDKGGCYDRRSGSGPMGCG